MIIMMIIMIMMMMMTAVTAILNDDIMNFGNNISGSNDCHKQQL